MTVKTMQRRMVATLVGIDDAAEELNQASELKDAREIRRRVKVAEQTLADLERRLGEETSVEVSQAAKILAVSPADRASLGEAGDSGSAAGALADGS